MRKISLREERKKKENRNKVIVSIVLALLMVTATLGFAFYWRSDFDDRNTTGDRIVYNGVEFVFQQGKWFFEIDGEQFATSNNPEDVEDIEVNIDKSIEDYSDEVVYFEDSSPGLGILEIQQNMARYFLRSQEACLDNRENLGECSEGLPERGCDENIIIIKDVEEDGGEDEGMDDEEYYEDGEEVGDSVEYIGKEGNEVWQEDNCVYIRSRDLEAVNAFIFRVFGITE